MPAALSFVVRQEIIQRREAGESFVSIADRLQVSYEAVRKIYHQYRKTGQVTPAYERCRHLEVRKPAEVYEQAVALKAAHPKWGAGLIRTELADSFAAADLPSARTLQRWFKRAGVQQGAREHVPRQTIKRGKAAHEVWALDAKEEIQLADGTYVSWLTVTDEGSGAILDSVLFPPQTLDDGRSASGQVHPANDHAAVGTPGAHPYG